MSAPSIPPDNSAQIESMREADAERQRQEQAAADAANKAQLAQLRSNAGTAARGSAQDYFTQQGLDPSQYSTDIDSKINSILAGIAPDDPNPGSYFTNIGPTVFDAATTGYRTKEGNLLNNLFPTNFDTQRVPLTLDDPYLSGIQAEQYKSADDLIQNMLSRGVITPTGYNAAKQNLDTQTPGVMAQLNEIGTGTLNSEQQALRDIANNARTAASTINLGQNFDPQSYGTQADQQFTDFLNNLSTTLRGKLPGSLYNTGGLAAIAGAGQGAQNLPFDPAALAGVATDTTKKQNTTTENVF